MGVPAGKSALGNGPVPEESLVRQELARILASPAFRASKRCQDFLAYVVGKTLAGSTESLKERTIAVEVFGRDADTDLDHDSIVRVGAREVRKRLAECYAAERSPAGIRIELPTGSYLPVFRTIAAGTLDLAPGEIVPAVPHAGEQRPQLPGTSWWKQKSFLVAVAITLLAAAVLSLRLIQSPPEPFDVFWQPAVQHKSPVLMVLAHPIIYLPSLRARRMSDTLNPPVDQASDRPLNVPAKDLDGSDFVPVYDHYVGVGDTVAAVEVAKLFERLHHPTQLRVATKLQFADLRSAPAVLIGAFTNRWTVDFMQGAPYRFSLIGGIPSLEDPQSGKKWALVEKSANDRSREDYLLICRLPQSKSGNFVIMGAGLTQYGTEEAGRILANPTALTPILKSLPKTWSTTNLALVLHSQIVGDGPAPPELTAWKTW